MNVINMEQQYVDDSNEGGDVLGPALLNMYITNEYACLEKKYRCGGYDKCGVKNGCSGCKYADAHFGLMSINRHQRLYVQQRAAMMFEAGHSKKLRVIGWSASVKHTFEDVCSILGIVISIVGTGIVIGLGVLPVIFFIWIVRLLLK